MSDDLMDTLDAAAFCADHTEWQAAIRSAIDEIVRLRAELEHEREQSDERLDYRWWADLLAGNNCYCVPDSIDPGVCLPCAYRQTVRLADEAVLSDPSPAPCEACGGKPCPKCDGSGVVAEQHEPWATEMLGCPWCFGEPCPSCGGEK